MERITGVIQNYAWGSTDGIPAVLGSEPSGEPQAEYWLGAHPKAPSLTEDGQNLEARIAAHPELLGEPTRQRFGDRLPFLLKILSARQALSLQAHPSRTQAIEGFQAEDAAGIDRGAPNRNYRDDWPKPETLLALTEFHGLCGFREPSATQVLFEQLGVPEATLLVEPITDRDGLARVFLEILALADQAHPVIDAVVARASERTEEDSDFGRFCQTAVELNRDYPSDPGVLAGLLLNRIRLEPGEAFFMPAGNLHAYLRGTGLEIMSNSDNVLRGGLTPKHIDVDELAVVVDFMPGLPDPVVPVEVAPGIRQFRTPVPEFALHELGPVTDGTVPMDRSARILLVLEGPATLTGPEGSLELSRGEAAFLGAGETVTVMSPGRLVMASSGA